MIRAAWAWLSQLLSGCRCVTRWNSGPTGGGRIRDTVPGSRPILSVAARSAIRMRIRTLDMLTVQEEGVAVRLRRHLLVEFEIAPRADGGHAYLALNTIISSSC
ncbi:MAG: hypothetical protein IANPNBLG_00429 [Bryobacteraceae bacterium]|nr:hypothetical protein [Bryobacteraceae bacterium]